MHIRYQSRDGGGSCDSARQYLAREEKFANGGDTVRWVQSLHMPAWAGDGSAAPYWRAAEGKRSRVNARTGILVEFALPKNLPPAEQDALALRMVEQLSSMAIEGAATPLRLPVTLAVHEGHGRNPHVHALVSTSMVDGIARTADTWFRRHMPKLPEVGGARRSVYVTKRRWVHHVRQAWASLANAALQLCGLEPTMDNRSHAARGSAQEPQIHLGPRIAHMAAQGIDTSRGARHAEIDRQNAERSELDARILRRRRTVVALEQSEAAALHAEHAWALRRNEQWCQVLEGHPLAGGIDSVRARATAIVVESDRENWPALGEAFRAEQDVRRFAGAVGSAWEPVSTPGRFWAIKPNQDFVVLLCPAYAATEADDELSLVAMISAALMLPLRRPALFVKEKVRVTATELMLRLDLQWPVVQLDVDVATALAQVNRSRRS
jgi:hypothetical protein